MAKRRKREAKFDPDNLNKSVIALPLLEEMIDNPEKVHRVLIDVNLDHIAGRKIARELLINEIKKVIAVTDPQGSYVMEEESEENQQYVFAYLSSNVVQEIARSEALNNPETRYKLIYKIWPDFPVSMLVSSSIKTVKADAAKRSFSAFGYDIVWAVLDSGVDKQHPHFTGTGVNGQQFSNLDTGYDKDFTGSPSNPGDPFHDENGHGTHVAGIIAGEGRNVVAAAKFLTESNKTEFKLLQIPEISGIAAKCKIVSLKVLDAQGNGHTSNIIRALNHVQEINSYGRDIKIHGINISLGNHFEPEWFACGQSPLCVEVNRLVKSGVVVVVAAGNSGYGYLKNIKEESFTAGLTLSIFDPGNAEYAITVGSTHRDMPHVYGVSYFSSKGPTGDGRLKPDLVAPGEKIISCATGFKKAKLQNISTPFEYVEDSGTSMAAPHVSGVIAAFLSVRREFIGQPEKVKDIFVSTATDLKRDRYFQGSGLVDLMRALQSV